MAWVAIWFGGSNTCGGVWLKEVGQNMETDEEHDEDCVEEGFQLTSVKLDKDGEEGREALGMGNHSINIWIGWELELAWSNKSSSYFECNFPIFLLYGISNTSIFKVRDVLHWVNSFVMEIFSNSFRSTFCWGRLYLNIFFILFIFYYWQQVLFTLRVSS